VARVRGATSGSQPWSWSLEQLDERKKPLVVDDDRSLAAQLVAEADALGCGMDIATICPRPGMQSAAHRPMCRGA